MRAAIQGAKQVSGAIMASTLTTVCVFLPIVFTQGISRQLFTDMGLTIAYSLIASLIVALTLVPMMASTLLKNNKEKEHKLFDRVVGVYEKALRWVLKRKAPVLLLVVLLLGFSIWRTLSMGTAFLPEMDSPQMSVTLTMPEGAKQDEIASTTDQVVEILSGIDGIETIGALQSGEGEGSVDMYLLLKEKRDLSNQEIAREIAQRTEGVPCEVEVSASTMDMSAMGGSGIQILIKGSDPDTLRTIAGEVASIVKSTPGTAEVTDGQEESSTETRITVDKAKAMENGLTVAQVYQKVSEVIADGKTATT